MPFGGRMVKRAGVVLGILAALGWCAGSASAAVLNVGSCVHGGYPTISAAVTAANAGDTVSVCPGTYPEIVTITKNLTLVGKTPSPGSFATLTYPSSPGQQCADMPFLGDCPQILVNGTTAQIQHLHIDGSDYARGCTALPFGILFYNASGGAQYNDIRNHACDPSGANGYGIFAENDTASPHTLLAQGNYVGSFGFVGILTEDLVGNVLNNSVSDDFSNNIGIQLRTFAPGSSALNNTIWGTGTAAHQAGIVLTHAPQTTMVRNSVNNLWNGIELDFSDHTTLNANTLKDVSLGITLFCNENDKFISNKVSDQPATDGEYGVNIYDCSIVEQPGGSDNNLLNGNSFYGLCSGVLTGSALNTGNVLISNTFHNIGPGADVMAGNNCP